MASTIARTGVKMPGPQCGSGATREGACHTRTRLVSQFQWYPMTTVTTSPQSRGYAGMLRWLGGRFDPETFHPKFEVD